MSMTIRRSLCFLASMLLLSATALHAQDAPDTGSLDLGKLRGEQLALRPQIESAQGRYAEMPRKQRDALLARQTELLALIDGKQSLAELGPEQRIEALNAVQALATAEHGTKSDRQVCKREKSIGSHRMTTVCRSKEQSGTQETDALRKIDANRMGREF